MKNGVFKISDPIGAFGGEGGLRGRTPAQNGFLLHL